MTGSYLKQLQILHGAFCAGVLIFIGVAAFVVYQEGALGMDTALLQPLTIVAVALAVAGLAAGIILPVRLIEKARAGADVHAKLAGYRTAFILGMALLEGPALFSVVLYLLTGNVLALIITAMLVGRMLMMRPTREKIITALGLQYDEADTVEGLR